MSVQQTHHQQIAERIHQEVLRLRNAEANDLDIFVGMVNHMDTFRTLMDTASPGDMDRLCARYEGFCQYAKILEDIAQGIETGDVQVPSWDH